MCAPKGSKEPTASLECEIEEVGSVLTPVSPPPTPRFASPNVPSSVESLLFSTLEEAASCRVSGLVSVSASDNESDFSDACPNVEVDTPEDEAIDAV